MIRLIEVEWVEWASSANVQIMVMMNPAVVERCIMVIPIKCNSLQMMMTTLTTMKMVNHIEIFRCVQKSSWISSHSNQSDWQILGLQAGWPHAKKWVGLCFCCCLWGTHGNLSKYVQVVSLIRQAPGKVVVGLRFHIASRLAQSAVVLFRFRVQWLDHYQS